MWSVAVVLGELLMSISGCRSNVNVYSHSFVSENFIYGCSFVRFVQVYFCGLEKTL